MSNVDKDKNEIIQQFISNTVENAKVIYDDKTTIVEKITARISQGVNVRSSVFRMQQLKFKNSNLKIGGVVHHCDDIELVVERELEPQIVTTGERSNSITINVDTELTEDVQKKICDAIKGVTCEND